MSDRPVVLRIHVSFISKYITQRCKDQNQYKWAWSYQATDGWWSTFHTGRLDEKNGSFLKLKWISVTSGIKGLLFTCIITYTHAYVNALFSMVRETWATSWQKHRCNSNNKPICVAYWRHFLHGGGIWDGSWTVFSPFRPLIIHICFQGVIFWQ